MRADFLYRPLLTTINHVRIMYGRQPVGVDEVVFAFHKFLHSVLNSEFSARIDAACGFVKYQDGRIAQFARAARYMEISCRWPWSGWNCPRPTCRIDAEAADERRARGRSRRRTSVPIGPTPWLGIAYVIGDLLR